MRGRKPVEKGEDFGPGAVSGQHVEFGGDSVALLIDEPTVDGCAAKAGHDGRGDDQPKHAGECAGAEGAGGGVVVEEVIVIERVRVDEVGVVRLGFSGLVAVHKGEDQEEGREDKGRAGGFEGPVPVKGDSGRGYDRKHADQAHTAAPFRRALARALARELSG